ncbi:MAG: hypothetical protein FWE05_13415 [Defluviitaleaceae bacterium]|nr:hypothetical protein [Defluviitaleaceae bacterium]
MEKKKVGHFARGVVAALAVILIIPLFTTSIFASTQHASRFGGNWQDTVANGHLDLSVSMGFIGTTEEVAIPARDGQNIGFRTPLHVFLVDHSLMRPTLTITPIGASYLLTDFMDCTRSHEIMSGISFWDALPYRSHDGRTEVELIADAMSNDVKYSLRYGINNTRFSLFIGDSVEQMIEQAPVQVSVSGTGGGIVGGSIGWESGGFTFDFAYLLLCVTQAQNYLQTGVWRDEIRPWGLPHHYSNIEIPGLRQLLENALENAAPPETVMARPSNHNILLDGEPIQMRAFNIGGYNHFRLRDLAYALNHTQISFAVEWDAETSIIQLITQQNWIVDEAGDPVEWYSVTGIYQSTGNEMAVADDHERTGVANFVGLHRIMTVHTSDGDVSQFDVLVPRLVMAYNIGGYNYIRLRDLAELFGDMNVDFDPATSTILIDTQFDPFA